MRGHRRPRILEGSRLEANHRTKTNLQIVFGSVVKVNFVSGFQPQPNRAPESLYACSRIKRDPSIAVRHRTQCTREPRGPILIRRTEVHKPNFTRHKPTNRPTHFE